MEVEDSPTIDIDDDFVSMESGRKSILDNIEKRRSTRGGNPLGSEDEGSSSGKISPTDPENDIYDIFSSLDYSEPEDDENGKKGEGKESKKKDGEKNKKKISAAEIEKYKRFYEIQQEHVKRRKDEIERLKSKKEKKLSKKCTFKPEIIDRSRKVSHVHKGDSHREYLLKWEEKRKENIENLRKYEAEKKFKATFKPKLSSKSKSLLSTPREGKEEYENPISGWRKRVKNYQASRKPPEIDRKKFSPRLSRKTKNLTKDRFSEVPFHVRLYVDEYAVSILKKKTLEQKLSQRKKEEKKIPKKKLIEHFNTLHEDSVRRRNHQLTRKKKHVENLYQECTHKPKISEISREIAKMSKLRKPLYHRHHNNNNSNKKKKKKKKKGESGSQGNVISKKSKIIFKNNKSQSLNKKRKRGVSDRRKNKNVCTKLYEREIQMVLKREKYLTEQRLKKESQKLESCTFTPQLSTITKRKNEKMLSLGRRRRRRRTGGYRFDFGLKKNERKRVFREDTLFKLHIRDYLEGRPIEDDEVVDVIRRRIRLEEKKKRLDDEKEEEKEVDDDDDDVGGQRQQEESEIEATKTNEEEKNGEKDDDDDDDVREIIESGKIQVIRADSVEQEQEQQQQQEVEEIEEEESSQQQQPENNDDDDDEDDDEEEEEEEKIDVDDDVRFEEMGEIEEEIDTAFDDWERLSSSFDM